jgi:hypothetical protein
MAFGHYSLRFSVSTGFGPFTLHETMLCGDKDSWTPVRQCKNNLPKDKIGHEVNL